MTHRRTVGFMNEEKSLCKNGDGRPVHCKDECQPCYRKTLRRERGLQKPGPKPDPSKPFSRHGGELTHHGKRVKCKYGHEFDGVDENGKQTCSTCADDRANAPCPAGHSADLKDNYGNCRTCVNTRSSWYRWASKYKLSREQLEAMLAEQGYACKICRKAFDLEAKYPFNVDHDHSCCPGQFTCGECVRGALCLHCNRLLGAAKDSPEILRTAIRYLEGTLDS